MRRDDTYDCGIGLRPFARCLRGFVVVPVLLVALLALDGCTGTGLAVSSDQVDFGGNYASHGHP